MEIIYTNLGRGGLEAMSYGSNYRQSNFLEKVVSKYYDYSDKADTIGKRAYETLTNTVDRSLGERARRVVRQYKINRGSDDIGSYYTFDDVILLPIKMRKYVMASPKLHDYKLNGFIDGYGQDTAALILQGRQENNIHYRHVMDGMGVVEDDKVVYTQYHDTTSNPLTVEEQFVITNTWQIMENMIANNLDPTNLGTKI